MKTIELKLSEIRIDGGTQSRASLNTDVVSEYAEILQELPPVDVFVDGSDKWLAGGFHRYHAAKKAGTKTISAIIHNGTRRDAVLFAVGDNGKHGVRPNNADKRHAAELLLKDEEWAQWSDHEIAKKCDVSHTFIAKVRKSLTSNVASQDSEKTPSRTYKHGKSGEPTTMNTSAIGKKSEPEKPPEAKPKAASATKSNDKPKPEAAKASPVVAEPTPAEPWATFNARIAAVQSSLRMVAGALRDVLEYDSSTKQLKSKWATGYNHDGTISAINGIIRTLDLGLPVELSSKPPGYLTNYRKSIQQMKPAA